MSRPLEFQAYDIRANTLIKDALILNSKLPVVEGNKAYFQDNPLSCLDGCVWMQYAGKTKENIKLYEGDFVEFSTLIFTTEGNQIIERFIGTILVEYGSFSVFVEDEDTSYTYSLLEVLCFEKDKDVENIKVRGNTNVPDGAKIINSLSESVSA